MHKREKRKEVESPYTLTELTKQASGRSKAREHSQLVSQRNKQPIHTIALTTGARTSPSFRGVNAVSEQLGSL